MRQGGALCGEPEELCESLAGMRSEKLFMQRKLATGGGHVEAQRASRQISDAPRRRALWRTRRAVRKPRRNEIGEIIYATETGNRRRARRGAAGKQTDK